MPPCPARRRHGHDGVVGCEHGRGSPPSGRPAPCRARAARAGRRRYFTEMMTVFSNESPMLSVRDRLDVGHRQVDDATLVGVERTHLLRQARVLGLPGEEDRHLVDLGVLVAAIPVAVDDQPAFVAGAIGDETLRRRSAAAPAGPHPVAASAPSHRRRSRLMRRPSGLFFERGGEVEAHRLDDVLHEVHDRVVRVHLFTPATIFGGPIIQLVKYCWPIAQRLLTNQ